MRFLHIADVHLGALANSWPDPATGIPTRLLDVSKCWEAACMKAIEEHVDAVVLAGDTFHSASPDPVSLAFLRRGLNLLASGGGIPTLIIAGNHDRAPHPGQPSVLEAFHGPRVTVVTRPTSVEVGGISFACLPSVSRHQLMSEAYTSYVLDADEQLVDGLRRVIDGFRPLGDEVLVGHWPIAGSMLGLEKDIAITAEPMLHPADVAGPWSYAAFGHIHKRQELENYPSAYAGSIDRMNFGEEGEPKGGYIVDLPSKPSGGVTLTPFDTPARTFVTVDLDEATFSDLEFDPEGAIIRIRGDHDTWAERAPVARKLFLDNGAALVRVDLQRSSRVVLRSAAAAEAPGPLEALDVYLEHREVPEDDRPPIRSRARDLVEGAV